MSNHPGGDNSMSSRTLCPTLPSPDFSPNYDVYAKYIEN